MPTSIPVLCYHNISDVDGHSPRRFEEHLAAIQGAGFRTISARELVAGLSGVAALPPKTCVLTFDDCHLSNWTIAAPLLAKYGMTAAFFCVTDFIGDGPKRPQLAPEQGGPELLSAPESFRRVLDADDRSQFMNEAELRAMVQDFGFEVHGHSARHQGAFRSLIKTANFGASHAHWSATGIYPAELRHGPEAAALPLFEVGSGYVYNGYWPTPGSAEAGGGVYYRRRTDAERRAHCLADFKRCFDRIRGINGCGDEQYFCWPWGQYDGLSESCAQEVGFRAAFTLERSANVSGTNPMRIHRIGVGKTKDGAWVQSRLRMYSGGLSARFFFKFLRKRPEIASILYMTDSDKLSGGSRQMVNNILGMRECGLRVTAVIPPGSEIRTALAPLTLGENPVEVVEFGGFRQYVRAASFVAELAKRVEADVVHTFHARAYKSAAIAKLKGGRFSLFINRGVIFPPNTIFALYALAAKGVTVNSLVCAEVLRKYQVPQNRLRLVYNSFLPENGALPPERLPQKKRGCRVLYVGNEGPAKGFDVFLRMAAELALSGVRDLEFVAAGVRDMRSFEQFLTPQLKTRLNLLGHLAHDAVLRELTQADVLVLPSRQESLPNVLLEAFACCLPVVCTSVGGMPELVHDGVNGFLRPSEDVSGLADAVARLAGDPCLRLRMGRINRRLVARHLGNAAKTLTLLRSYFGEALFEPLPIEALARQVALEESLQPLNPLDEAAPCQQT
ncbi:MAG: glycosyltransferase [Humidesulfovibrio sp.]|uniref:glycosyltransferase n=1 Tax=Humidesulfovibrio sp. TaxID=2910988 RepID=UPI002733FBCB|nr:glycosyltransferase [Humidesulfovibrio sp.]MDP2849194.1 glycosyltransferase [Humidesulfovibrio sp.]